MMQKMRETDGGGAAGARVAERRGRLSLATSSEVPLRRACGPGAGKGAAVAIQPCREVLPGCSLYSGKWEARIKAESGDGGGGGRD